jgi:hypothetical protein
LRAHRLDRLRAALARRRLTGRGAAVDGAFASTPFNRLARFNRGGLFVGRFTGRTPWERHRHGDGLVLTVLTAPRSARVRLRAGSVFVVPRGLWHRQHARRRVTLLSATPTPTDVSFADDPRPARRRSAARAVAGRARG